MSFRYIHVCDVYLLSSSDERVTLDFGRTLQQARTSKGMTQKELATVSRNSF